MKDLPKTIPQLAEMTGYSRGWLYEVTHRGKGFHPLPCVRSGNRAKIRPSVFYKWLAEEERRQAV